MQLQSIKTAIAISWILVIVVGGLVSDVRSVSGWALLTALAVLPPLVMLWLWNAPRPTMSEAIQKALH
jgi:hypothetical protein